MLCSDTGLYCRTPLQEIEAIEAAIEELRVKRQNLKRKFDDQVHLYKYTSQT